MSATITTAGTYGTIVDPQMVRDALNLRSEHPNALVLNQRIAEAASRVEGLTRVVLPEQVWEYELNLPEGQESLSVAGLFPIGGDPDITITDADGTELTITAKVQGRGESLLVTPDSGTLEGELTITVTRGVSADELPEDLRSAIVTAVEQLIDGFTPLAEGSIIRTCSRYGFIG